MTNYSKLKRFRMKHLSKMGIVSLLWRVVRLVILFGLSFMVLYPFFTSIIDSFKSFEDFLDPAVRFIPKYFTWANIKEILLQIDWKNSYTATFGFSALIAVMQVGVCALAGYGFARFKFFGSNILFFCVILSLIIPPQTLMIPLFIRFRFFYGGLNLIGGYWPVIILAATGLGIKNGLYIFMFRQFFKNMPKELEEAAYIDGCNTFQTFYRVMLPSAVSLMVTVFLLSFAWQWTDTTYSSLYMTKTPLLANKMTMVDGGEEGIMIAMYNSTAAILAVLPVAVVYLFGQRFFIQGVERSGITG